MPALADPDSHHKPTAATPELAIRRPSGEKRCTMGPAKKRSTIMMAEV